MMILTTIVMTMSMNTVIAATAVMTMMVMMTMVRMMIRITMTKIKMMTGNTTCVTRKTIAKISVERLFVTTITMMTI